MTEQPNPQTLAHYLYEICDNLERFDMNANKKVAPDLADNFHLSVVDQLRFVANSLRRGRVVLTWNPTNKA